MNYSSRIRSFLLLIISFLVCNSQAFSQNLEPVNKKIMYIEKNIFPAANGNLLYLSYKIPFSNLVFIKRENKFYSSLKVEFELFLSGKVIAREASSKSVLVDKYEDTKSKEKYVEGLVKFELKENNYTILPLLFMDNTKATIILDSLKITIDNFIKGKIYNPIVLERKTNECENILYKIVNLQNSVPFKPQDYTLLIPVNDSINNKIFVKIEQDDKLIYEDSTTRFVSSELILQECGNTIGIFNSNAKVPFRYFFIDSFNYSLKEGNAKLFVYSNNKPPQVFNLYVLWENKPNSLNDILFSIEILDLIENKNIVTRILNRPRNELYKYLFEYWDKKQPNRKYAFNDLMNEFYNRVDYAMENFSTVSNKNGAKTDRGKIYIIYGKPDEIFRNYFNNGVSEVWYYRTINKQFVFFDRSGLGDYILEK